MAHLPLAPTAQGPATDPVKPPISEQRANFSNALFAMVCQVFVQSIQYQGSASGERRVGCPAANRLQPCRVRHIQLFVMSVWSFG